MGTPSQTPKLFGISDLKIYQMLTDVAGSAPTYGPGIDMPGVQSIAMGFAPTKIDGRGDERIMEIEYQDDESDVSFAMLYAPLAAQAIINGGYVDTTTDSNAAAYYGPTVGETGSYFKIECLTKPRSEKLVIYKVKGALLFDGLTGGQFNMSTFKGTAIHTQGNITNALNSVSRRFALLQTSNVYTVSGMQEVITTAVNGVAVSTAGIATAIFTKAGMTGSPKTVSVPLALTDSLAVQAQKIREAANADVNVSASGAVTGSGTAVVWTFAASGANDATANIALAPGTSVGMTAAPTSTISVPGSV